MDGAARPRPPSPHVAYVVARGHLAYIPGLSMWIRILRRVYGILLLAAQNIAHSSQSVFGLASSGVLICFSFVLARVIISLGCFRDAGAGLSAVIRHRP